MSSASFETSLSSTSKPRHLTSQVLVESIKLHIRGAAEARALVTFEIIGHSTKRWGSFVGDCISTLTPRRRKRRSHKLPSRSRQPFQQPIKIRAKLKPLPHTRWLSSRPCTMFLIMCKLYNYAPFSVWARVASDLESYHVIQTKFFQR